MDSKLYIKKVLFKLGDEVTFSHKGQLIGTDKDRPFFYLVVEDETNKKYILHLNAIKIA